MKGIVDRSSGAAASDLLELGEHCKARSAWTELADVARTALERYPDSRTRWEDLLTRTPWSVGDDGVVVKRPRPLVNITGVSSPGSIPGIDVLSRHSPKSGYKLLVVEADIDAAPFLVPPAASETGPFKYMVSCVSFRLLDEDEKPIGICVGFRANELSYSIFTVDAPGYEISVGSLLETLTHAVAFSVPEGARPVWFQVLEDDPVPLPKTAK